VGINSRLDALQAAILSVKLKRIDEWNEKRREIANKYDQSLAELVQIPVSLENRLHAYHQYPIVTDDRDGLQGFLKENGVASAIYYPLPLHLQECFRNLGYNKGELPISEKTSENILSLPIFPEMTDGQIEYVIGTVKKYF